MKPNSKSHARQRMRYPASGKPPPRRSGFRAKDPACFRATTPLQLVRKWREVRWPNLHAPHNPEWEMFAHALAPGFVQSRPPMGPAQYPNINSPASYRADSLAGTAGHYDAVDAPSARTGIVSETSAPAAV